MQSPAAAGLSGPHEESRLCSIDNRELPNVVCCPQPTKASEEDCRVMRSGLWQEVTPCGMDGRRRVGVAAAPGLGWVVQRGQAACRGWATNGATWLCRGGVSRIAEEGLKYILLLLASLLQAGRGLKAWSLRS